MADNRESLVNAIRARNRLQGMLDATTGWDSIARDEIDSFVNNAGEDDDEEDEGVIDNAFCPTGEGGGTDPHCGKDGGHGSSKGHGGPGTRPALGSKVTSHSNASDTAESYAIGDEVGWVSGKQTVMGVIREIGSGRAVIKVTGTSHKGQYRPGNSVSVVLSQLQKLTMPVSNPTGVKPTSTSSPEKPTGGVSKEHVLSAVKAMAGRSNHVHLSDIGEKLGLTPQQLHPHIQQLRREGILTGSALEGRSGITEKQKSYVTSDNIGIVSLRE